MSTYTPWRYADRALVRQRRADQFRQRAEERDYRSIEATQRAQLPPTGYGGTTAAALDKKSGGGSLWKKAKGAADAVTPDLAEDAVKGAAKGALKGALTTLDAPRKYVGAPAFGVLSGLTEADREYDPKTGRYYRKTATIKEAGKGILDAFTQNPAKTYREGKQATEEYAADPNKNVLHRAGLNIATDPLSYVGPGLAAKGIKMAGLAGKAATAGEVAAGASRTKGMTKLGRAGYELLDSGGPGVVIGGNVAASAEQEYGEKVPGWNRLSPELRSLGAALVGGVTGGTALRGAKMETAAGRGERGSIDFTKKGPQKSPDLIKVRHADIQELPGTFQARNADEGKSYSEDRVKELQRIWDPNQLEPGSLVRDTNTGELTVFSGHHRKVLMERQAAAGLYPDEGTWEVYDADLSNPAHVKELQRIADYKNYGTATMKLNENVRVYRRAKARGETDDVIFDSMRSVNRLERQYLPYLADMPDDLIERVMQANGSIANLGEIGKAARTYGFTEPEIRAFFGRYGTGGKGQEITPTALKAKLETVGRDIDAIRAQKKQGGMFDDDVIAKVLVTVDEIDAADAELRIQRARLVSTDKQLAEIEAKAPPELVEATAQLRTYIQGEVRRLERERAKGIADYEATKRAKWEGTPDPGDNQRPVPEGDGGRPEVPGRAAPQAGTRVTNPEVGTWIDQGGTPVEVVAKEGAQIRVRGGDGSESWIQTAPDMFGESPTFTVTEKPLAERPRPVQTETGTQQGFGGSVQELPGIDTGAPKPPAPEPRPVTPEPTAGVAREAAERANTLEELASFFGPSDKPWGFYGQWEEMLATPKGRAELKRRGEIIPLEAERQGITDAAGLEKFTQEWIKYGKPTAGTLPVTPEPRRFYDEAGNEIGGRARMDDAGEVRAETPRPEEPAAPRAETPPPPKEEFGPEDFEPKGPPPPLSKTNDHATLGLDPSKTYTADEIRAAYRAQARLYHPDVNTSATATADMKTINAAFERLSGKSAAGPRPGAARDAGNRPEWDRWQEQYRRARDDARRWADEQDAARQRARERWRNEAPEREARRTEMRRENVEGFEQAGMEPPVGSAPPPGAPPVRDRGPNVPLGSSEQPFNWFEHVTQERQAALDAEMSRRNTWAGKAEFSVRRAITRLYTNAGARAKAMAEFMRSPETEAVMRQRYKMEKVTDSLATDLVQVERQAVEAAFPGWSQTEIVDALESRGPAGQAANAAFTPEQRAVVDLLRDANEKHRKTVEGFGGTVSTNDALDVDGGTYFGRKVESRDGVEKAAGPRNSTRVGAERGHSKQRTQESMAGGEVDGIVYADMWEAREQIHRGKLRDAMDAHLKQQLAPLSGPPESLGFSTVNVKGHPGLAGLNLRPDIGAEVEAALKKGDVPGVVKLINGFLTPLRATADISAIGQQGIGLWLAKPVKAAEAAWKTVYSAMGHPEVYDALVADLVTPEMRRELIRHGLDQIGHSGDELQFPAWLTNTQGRTAVGAAGKVARFSNDAFARFTNYMRLSFAKDAYERTMKLAEVNGWDDAKRTAELNGAMAGANRISGRGTSAPTTLERAVMFAPRYFRGNIEQVIALAGRGTEAETAMARAHMMRLLAGGAGFAYGINSLRGKETELDPRSTNFLKIRNVGGLDISPFGAYDTLMRYGAQIVAGEPGKGDWKKPWESADPVGGIGRLARAKASPALGIFNDLFWQKDTYRGEPLDISSKEGALKAIGYEAKGSLPFSVQNLIEGIIEGGPVAGAKGAVVGATGLNAAPLSPSEKLAMARDTEAGKLFKKGYDDLSGEQRSQVNATTGVAGAQEKSDKRALARGGESAERVENRKLFKERMAANAKYLAAGKDDEGNPFSGNDYRDAYHELQTFLAGRRDTLKSEYKSDKEVSGWFDLYDTAAKANGQLDFAKLDSLQAAYRSAHPDIDGKVDAITGTSDDATLREYRRAQGLAKMYYDLPSYRGLTKEQADHANEVLMQAQDMVSFGTAKDFQAALRKLGRDDPTGASLARRAKRAGSNPARKAFRRSHPLLARYYSDLVGDIDVAAA